MFRFWLDGLITGLIAGLMLGTAGAGMLGKGWMPVLGGLCLLLGSMLICRKDDF